MIVTVQTCGIIHGVFKSRRLTKPLLVQHLHKRSFVILSSSYDTH